MALTTPTLFYTPAFDATQGYTFTFNVVGGSQVVANKLVIRNNSTNDIVYSEKIETFKYEHKLPASRLTNGTYYNATITTFDEQGNESQPSTPIQFWCYETPVLRFTNIPLTGLIVNSSFEFEFEYTQANGEKLNSYKVNLYDTFQSLIASSGVSYVSDGTPPYSNSYIFTGLQDNVVYYVEVEGITINDTVVSSGLQEITVRYVQPEFFSVLEVTNNCDEGYITIKSNASLIDGSSNPSPPKYIDDKEVDVTAPDSWVEFSQGFSIVNDFLMRLWFRSPTANTVLAKLSNTLGQTITVYYREGYETEGDLTMKAYIDILVESLEGIPYYIYSNYVDILPKTEYYNLWLGRKNKIYQLQLAKV